MLAAGVVAGVLAGLLGVGGGIVVVPALEWLLELNGVPVEFRMHIAVATSLAVIIPTSVASARAHHRRGSVDIELARRWTPWIIVGAILGTAIASRVDGPVLSAVFGIVAILVALKLALPLDKWTLAESVPRSPLLAPLPATIGTVSTMMGIGGGSLTVPSLTILGEPIHRAVGTSALFGLLIAVPGALGFVVSGWTNDQLPAASLGYVNLLGFVLIAPTTVLAAPLGARLAHALPHRQLSLLFGVFLLLVAVRMLYQTVRGLTATYATSILTHHRPGQANGQLFSQHLAPEAEQFGRPAAADRHRTANGFHQVGVQHQRRKFCL